jgi:hypothetical protein
MEAKKVNKIPQIPRQIIVLKDLRLTMISIIIFLVRTFSRWNISNNILDLVVSTVMF